MLFTNFKIISRLWLFTVSSGCLITYEVLGALFAFDDVSVMLWLFISAVTLLYGFWFVVGILGLLAVLLLLLCTLLNGTIMGEVALTVLVVATHVTVFVTSKLMRWYIHSRLLVKIASTVGRGVVFCTYNWDGKVVEIDDTYDAPSNKKELVKAFMAMILEDIGGAGSWRIILALTFVPIWLVCHLLAGALVKASGRLVRALGRVAALAFVIFLAPSTTIDMLWEKWLMLWLWCKAFLQSRSFREVGSELMLWIVVSFTYMALMISVIFHWLAGSSVRLVKLRSYQNPMISRSSIMKLRGEVARVVRNVEDLRIPEGVRALYLAPNVHTIRESLEILKSIGLPVNVSVRGPTEDALSNSDWAGYSDWIMAISDFKQVSTTIRTMVGAELEPFRESGLEIPTYKYTGGYANPRSTIESTARYFRNLRAQVDYETVEDAWDFLGGMFTDSKLSTSKQVLANWNRKYSVGFGFMSEARSKVAMGRKEFIKQLGGEEKLAEVWDRLRLVAGSLTPIAHVFTKLESLKESKWAAGIVRSIIGVPLPHFALTSWFSDHQNRRHDYRHGPIKCGMPLNGAHFNELWVNHSTRKFHFAGDVTAFDSSIPPSVYDVVKELRKRGFSQHPDHDLVCQLVDVAYDQLMSMPLAFKESGYIARKGQGGATGQGNTSTDNSIALCVLYLVAWRRVTGLSAREFCTFNTLSNQADDHILSYDKNPFGWDYKRAIEEFAKMGVTMRMEVNSLDLLDMEFLAKKVIKVDSVERVQLAKFGIVAPQYLTCHNKLRLLGKINADQPYRDKQARVKRLLSYLYLTAHHKDVYMLLIKSIDKIRGNTTWGKKIAVPSYKRVMSSWYSLKSFSEFTRTATTEELMDLLEVDDTTAFVHVGVPSTTMKLVNAISCLPEVFSPRMSANGAARMLQKAFGASVAWPIELLRNRNPHLTQETALSLAMLRTSYHFITPSDVGVVPVTNTRMTLLLRHWMFMIWVWLRGTHGEFWTFARVLRTLDLWVANLNFMLDSKVSEGSRIMDLHLLDLLVLWVLSHVDWDTAIVPWEVDIPIPSNEVAYAGTVLWRRVQPSGRANYDSVVRYVRLRGTTKFNLVVSAPTGTGKSTRMVEQLHSATGRKVMVIEPRHVLVTGLVDYMTSAYPTIRFGAMTRGRIADPHAAIVYATFQSVMLAKGVLNPNTIYVIDEAHVDDPIYQHAVTFFMAAPLQVVFVTATPEGRLKESNLADRMELDALNVFQTEYVNEEAKSLDDYLVRAADIVNSRPEADISLVYVPTIKLGERLRMMMRAPSTLISSKTPDFDPNARVFIATKVLDAGVTLPDVSLVVTSDRDWKVSTTCGTTVDTVFESKSNNGFVKISSSIIRQRAGRTGRTCDGKFIFFRLLAPVKDISYTPRDLIVESGILLEDPSYVDNLPSQAKAIIADMQAFRESDLGEMMLEGRSLAQCFGIEEAVEDPSDWINDNLQSSMNYGLPGEVPIICEDPTSFMDDEGSEDSDSEEGNEAWEDAEEMFEDTSHTFPSGVMPEREEGEQVHNYLLRANSEGYHVSSEELDYAQRVAIREFQISMPPTGGTLATATRMGQVTGTEYAQALIEQLDLDYDEDQWGPQ